MGLLFLPKISDVFSAVCRDMLFWDKDNGVCSMDQNGYTLFQVVQLFSICLLPNGEVLGGFDAMSVFHELTCVSVII